VSMSFDSLDGEREFYRWPWTFKRTHERLTKGGRDRLGTIRDAEGSAVATNMHEMAAQHVIAVLARRYEPVIEELGGHDASTVHTEATD
jgi:hypothetical protein